MRHLSSMSLSLFALTGLLSVAGTGCMAEAPTTPYGHGTGADMAGHPTGGADASQVNPGMAAPPVLDAIEQTTPYDTVPVHGTAPPNTSVLFESDNGDTVTVDVSSSGRFCVDAPLSEGETTEFHVSTIDKWGNVSPKVDFSVTQSGVPQQQQAQPHPQNASLGGLAKANYLDVSQAPADTIDGNTQTWVEGQANVPWFSIKDPDPSVVVKLSSVSRINKIVAIAPSDCLFIKPMEVWYSAADAPSPPNVDPKGWVKAQQLQVSGDQLTATASFVTTVASHVAVLWPGGADYLQLGNCGTIRANFGLAELQAWTVPNEVPPPPRAPSCTGSN